MNGSERSRMSMFDFHTLHVWECVCVCVCVCSSKRIRIPVILSVHAGAERSVLLKMYRIYQMFARVGIWISSTGEF